MTIRIEGHNTPTANAFQRSHWGAKATLKSKWRKLLAAALYGHKWEVATTKKKVTVTRYSPRMMDQCNLYSPIDKLILDPLRSVERVQIGNKRVEVKGLGVIKDDSPQWLELEVVQAKGKAAMVIEVEDCK